MDLCRTAGYLGAASLLICSSEIRAAEPDKAAELPTIVVRIDNNVGMLPDYLQFAERRASEVFALIGARIRWVDQEEAASQHVTPPFTVLLVNAQGDRTSRFADALGLAHPGVRRAYVFYDRIAALNVGASKTIPILVGDVFAHELGHLMLSPPGHSAGGIMRPELETKSWHLETFTKPQAREVLSRVRALH